MHERILEDNILIGYYKDKAIVSSENGDLFYFDCPEGVIPEGSICDSGLNDLSSLPEEEQSEIRRRFSET